MVLVKKSYKTGISFGLVSGVLTTLGLLVGLGVGTQSREVIIGGILTIAVADALSDAFGVHLSQESSGENSKKTGLGIYIFHLSFKVSFSSDIFNSRAYF